MQLYGTLGGTAVWLLIGIVTMALAASQENQITGFIAVGWIMLAVFSFLDYLKEDEEEADG